MLRSSRGAVALADRLMLPVRLVAALLCLSLAACGVTRDQLDAAGAFGKSATSLADGAKAAYAQAALDEAEARLAQFIVLEMGGSSDPSIVLKNFNQPLVGLSKVQIKGRLAAAEALSAYGKALSTLLDSKSQASDFSAAVTGLAGAIKGIPSSVLSGIGITAAEIDGVGKVIVAIGDIALDLRRRQVLEEVVPAAQPVVTKICGMFGRDFNVQGRLLGTIMKSELQQTQADIENSFKKNGMTVQDRAILLPLYQKVATIRANSIVSFGSLKEAADSCVKASVQLGEAIKDPKLTLEDIIDFVAKAQAAFDTIKNISSTK